MKTTKKLLALLLALVMLMSAMPMGAFAVEADETVETAAATEADTVEATEVTEEPETTAEPTVEATTEATTEATEEPVEETTDPTETTEIALLDADELAEEQVADDGLGLRYENPRDTSGDPLYKILHIDAGRKYLNLAALERLVDNVAANGMNQINLYLSDNQGLRFGITDSEGKFIIRANGGTEYDLTNALGYYNYTADGKKTDSNSGYLTPSDMTALIQYAASQGVDIVPCINMPGHMAAILQNNKGFCKTFKSDSAEYVSEESLDMGNTAAVNFALAVLQAYCDWFAGIEDDQGNQLVKYFCIGADEYGQDLYNRGIVPVDSGFGTAYMMRNGEYDYLVDFLNRAGNVIKANHMTPRAFNDAFLSDGYDGGKLNSDYQLYYWARGWGGMNNATPQTLHNNGFQVINCNCHYYYVCCMARPYSTYLDTVEAIEKTPFDLKTFATDTAYGTEKVSFEPAGAMYCIWCDLCDGGQSHVNDITGNAMDVMNAWAACLSAVPDENYEYVEVNDNTTGVKIGATGLSEISVSKVSDPAILAAAEGKVHTYSVQMLNAQRDYTGSYRISLPIPSEWDAAKVRGFTVGELATLSSDNEATLPVREASGSVKGSYYVLDVDTPYAAVGIYEAADTKEGQTVVNITLSVDETYDFGGTLTGDYRSSAGETYGAFKIEVTDFVAAVPGIPAVAPSAIDMSTVNSDQEYLISDGKGNYMSVSGSDNPAVTNSTDSQTATKWKVTDKGDGTYILSTTVGTQTKYLKQQDWGAFSFDFTTESSSAATFTYDSESGLYTHRPAWAGGAPCYMEYTSGGWALTKDTPSGNASAVYDLGKKGTPDIPATTTLLLTATKAGTASVTIGGTVYNVTVIAGVTSARCEAHDITVSGHGVNGLNCVVDNTVTSINGYENINDVQITGYSLTPTVNNAAYKGEVQVKMPVPAGWTDKGGIIQAFLKQNNGTAVTIPVTIEGSYATYTVPGGTVSGLFKLPADYFTKEVSVLMGNDSEVIRTQPGAYTDSDVYYCDGDGLVTVTSKVTTPYAPAVSPSAVSAISKGESYYITDGKGNYLTIVDGQMANTTEIADAAMWKCEEVGTKDNYEGRYKLTSGGYQLLNVGNGFSLGAIAGLWQSPYFNSEDGLYRDGWYLVFDGENWINSQEKTGHSIVYGTGSEEVPAKSTVTIKSGAATGKTSVIVGTVKYNITIKDAELVNKTLRIYSMITNDLVLIDGTENSPVCHVDINAAMDNGINSEAGIDITKLFPAEAVRGSDKVVFWKMTWLPNGHRQSTETGSPYLKGEYAGGVQGDTPGCQTGYENRVDFTKLRYWENGWELYLDADQDAWNTTTKWGTGDGFVGWYPINPTEEDVTTRMPGATAGEGQIVAYYLQETAVTQEVTTNVADWGPAIGDSRNLEYGGKYVLLDFAVRYEDGVRNPNEIGTFPYSDGSYNSDRVEYTTDKTMSFHCNKDWPDVEVKEDGNSWRTINTIMATTDTIRGYEIYMITATDSYESTPLSTTGTAENKRNSEGKGGYDYDTKTETIVWLKDENVKYDSSKYRIDETNVAYGYRENGTHTNHVPLVNSVEIQMRHAKLITYYVRYVGKTEDALHVHYINRSLNNIEFYNYGIRVKSGTLFDTNFDRTDNEYGLKGNTVKNYYDVTQTVQGDPRQILDVPSFYRSVQLTLVDVSRSEDGKDVYLYYDTDNAKDMVVDFGLPVEISEKSMQLQLNQDETLKNIAAIDGEDAGSVQGKYYVTKAEYGYFYTDLASNRCYYVPFTVMRGTESMRMAVLTDKTTTSNPHRYVMSVYPATTVYYEEYFAKYEGTWTGSTKQPDVGENYVDEYIGKQQGAYPSMTDAYNYGYDTVYDTAKKTQATTETPGSKATFEFTGNGFEVYADCTKDTGTVAVGLYKVANGTDTLKSVYLVDTIRKDGNSDLTKYDGVSQNTPIVSVRDLAYGDYKVVMILTNYTSPAKFVFDGFRVFNTMGSDIDEKVYDKDEESQPEFVEVRDYVLFAQLPDKKSIEGSVYIDQIAEGVSSQVYNLKGDQKVNAVLMVTDGETNSLTDAKVVTDYLDNGTKNEVYVRPGQYLLITLPSEEIAKKTQIGMKTLTGTTTYGDKTISQTNMYYKGMNEGNTIKIDNTNGKSIISITDLKIPGGIPAGSATDTQSLQSGVQQALLQMGYKEEPKPTEPEPTEPEPTEPKPTEPSIVVPEDTYVSKKVYHRGDTVVFNGKTYKAKWWTRGENPETSQVWELVDDGSHSAAPAAWSPFKIYTAGMQVTYKGHVYEAKWWTIGLVPGKGLWSAWKQIS